MSYKVWAQAVICQWMLLYVIRRANSQVICTDACKCATSEGLINLKELDAVPSTSKPKWTEVPGTDNPSDKFSYNPCSSFSIAPPVGITGNCNTVGACLHQPTKLTDIGENTVAPFPTWSKAGDDYAITYTSYAAVQPQQTTVVTLKCAYVGQTEDKFEPQGMTSPNNYAMTLTSLHCCPGGNGRSGGGPGGPGAISPGSVLIIIFVIVLFSYILGGMVYNKTRKGASGVEMFPNYVFWKDFPILIKDGTLFVVRKIRPGTGAGTDSGKPGTGSYQKV